MQRILMASTLALNTNGFRDLDPEGVNYWSLNSAIWDPNCSEYQGATASACELGRFGFVRFFNPGNFISAAFPYLFSIAGLILFVMLVIGALEIMMGAGDPKSAESGQKRITTAVIGFLLLFASFWIAQIISIIFGLNIGLGGTPTP